MTEPTPEFSRILSAERLPPNGSEEALSAKPNERAALAKRFDLVELPLLTAQLSVTPQLSGNVIVTGTIKADVVQSCVVTLEPIASRLDIPVDVIFVPDHLQNRGAGSAQIEDEEEEIETYSNGKIDLGELVAQQLGINLDPYPRKPDAALTRTEFGATVKKPQPLAQLAALAKNAKNKGKTGD